MNDDQAKTQQIWNPLKDFTPKKDIEKPGNKAQSKKHKGTRQKHNQKMGQK